MKITCPKCNAAGSIPEHEVPEAGRFISCPRCQNGFTVTKPKAVKNEYRVDFCPACSFSTFGEETFSSCPKCGVVVKAFVDRQREDLMQQKNQELLGNKFSENNLKSPEEPDLPVEADFLENLHPVNLVGWGTLILALVIFAIGIWGLASYDSSDLQARLSEQRDEQVSGFYVFMHYGMVSWVAIIYGVLTGFAAVMFLKKRHSSLKAMSRIIWAGIIYVPVSHLVKFVYWVLAPIPHSIYAYLIEIFNILFMSALIGIPLYFLDRYLRDRSITTVVRY